MFYRHLKLFSFIFLISPIVTINAQELIPINPPSIKSLLNKKSINAKNTNSKIGYKIQNLMSQPNNVQTAAGLNSLKIKDNSKVQIYVKVINTNEDDLSELKDTGLEIEITNKKLKKIQGWINISDIEKLTKLNNVMKVSAPVYGSTNVGSQTTQGDALLLSNLLREQGISGDGVRIGVISDGSNGLVDAQSTEDLPSNVTLFRSCVTSAANCSEGVAMAEIIHDIAPDADLAIADGLESTLRFIQRLDQLANEFNADIIVDDLIFFNEPYFEDGDVAQAVSDLPEDILYVSAAGNNGERWHQSFYEPRNTFIAGSFIPIHNFGIAIDFDSDTPNATSFSGALPIRVLPSSQAFQCLNLQWSDPFVFDASDSTLNTNPDASDYDLLIFNSASDFSVENFVSPTVVDDSGSVVATGVSSNNTLEVSCFASPAEETVYFAVVILSSGEPKELKVFYPDGDIAEGFQTEGSVFGHAATNRAVAVGTINFFEPGLDDIAPFSSRGPSRIDFPTLEIRNKPDITAIDGVSVTASGGFPLPNFFGTSAAAPHIAAIAGLLKSARPNASVEEIRSALINGATDLGEEGIDNVFGAGLANAQESLSLLQSNDSDILDFLPAILEAVRAQNQ